MKIKVSAPGKLMLFGEHAVVYDRPCIVTAVSSRLHVELEQTPGRFKIDAPQVKDVRFVEEAVHLFKEKYGLVDGLSIKTSSDFSCQYGFGSSSAVTVATLLALVKLYRLNLSAKDIFNLGYQVTLNIQKVGSGFDIAAAAYGGVLYFLTGGKVIKPFIVNDLPIVVGYSGIKADTPSIVNNLKLKMKNKKLQLKIISLFNLIEKIVIQAKTALQDKGWEKLGELMNENQKLLQQLGVSTEKLDQTCAMAISAGAYGAKLSGAGGGDCMIALVSEEKRKSVEMAIRKAGGEIIKVKSNAEGVKLEK